MTEGAPVRVEVRAGTGRSGAVCLMRVRGEDWAPNVTNAGRSVGAGIAQSLWSAHSVQADGLSGITDKPLPMQDHLAYALYKVMKNSGESWKVEKGCNRRSSGV